MRRRLMAAMLVTMVVSLGGCSSAQSTNAWQARGYHGARWWAEAAKLTREQRDELASMTPTDNCGFNCTSSWNREELRWEEDVEGESYFEGRPMHKGAVGPHAILPLSEARAEENRKQEDYQWCDPKLTMFAVGDGLHQYHCVADARSPHPDRMGRVEEDKGAEAYSAKEQEHEHELAQAMTTRVLTDAEYKEVLALGSMLLVRPMQSYVQKEVDEQFEHMLRVQDELRMASKCEPSIIKVTNTQNRQGELDGRPKN